MLVLVSSYNGNNGGFVRSVLTEMCSCWTLCTFESSRSIEVEGLRDGGGGAEPQFDIRHRATRSSEVPATRMQSTYKKR